MKKMLSTKEVAQFLGVNEKMVYTLIADKELPATKVTGKWLFPRHLVEQWIETNTINYPETTSPLPPYHGLLIVVGSNDMLLDKTISLYNSLHPDQVVVFGNLGSMGGLKALRQNHCHIAACHLLHGNEKEYNFDFAVRELDHMPVVVNFCQREQGLLIPKNNPKNIKSFADLGQKGITLANRPLSTGTRLLLDKELKKAGISGENIEGYRNEFSRHLDVGLEILAGRADVGPGIRPVASFLPLDFIPLRWERYDLLITKERFFEEGIQSFLSLFHEKEFYDMAETLDGYDICKSGKMIFPQE